jgi:hypothetical protein
LLSRFRSTAAQTPRARSSMLSMSPSIREARPHQAAHGGRTSSRVFSRFIKQLMDLSVRKSCATHGHKLFA